MAVYNTYSKRNAQKKNDVFEYEIIPQKFRGQVVHILKEVLGLYETDSWINIHKKLCSELGNDFSQIDIISDITNFIKKTESTTDLLDSIDICFNEIYSLLSDYKSQNSPYLSHFLKKLQTALDDLNIRFFENGLGYQFNYGELFRIDNTHTHKEIVLPSILLIRDKRFESVEEEFFKAFEHYKDRNYEAAITEAGKAFESAMKTICKRKNYEFNNDDTASKLLTILKNKEFFSPMFESQMINLNKLISEVMTGLSTIRNKSGAHGQGDGIRNVPIELVQFTLNQVASNILFLIQSFNKFEN